jgi:hypothetical protein
LLIYIVDSGFSNVVDGRILVDLAQTDLTFRAAPQKSNEDIWSGPALVFTDINPLLVPHAPAKVKSEGVAKHLTCPEMV